MDGVVRSWRRLLHEYDPQVIQAKADGTFVATSMTDDKNASESEGEMIDAPSEQSEDDFVVIQPQ